MKNYKSISLLKHKELKGKIEIRNKVDINSTDDLSWAYSPGVAEPCKIIAKNKNEVYNYTTKSNTIAVITDGSAVLGLGNIGPEAALPVMEGKAMLFKRFANINAFPICLNSANPDEFINTVIQLSPSLGGINLEDISSPKCIYIENELKKRLNIPVFHDDQHGTAIATAAALINAAKLVKKKISDLKIALIGTGAAGSAIAKMLNALNVAQIHAYNEDGVVSKNKDHSKDIVVKELLEKNIINTPHKEVKTLEDVIKDKDVLIGVSTGNLVSSSMIKNMKSNAIVFAMANPDPEISYNDAKKSGAKIVGTGRSDYPNQINNVLAFPGIFKGALDGRVNDITQEMQIDAAYAIAGVVSLEKLSPEYIIPSVFDERVVNAVSQAVLSASYKS